MRTRAKKSGFKRKAMAAAAAALATLQAGCSHYLGAMHNSLGGTTKYEQPVGAVFGTSYDGERNSVGLNIEYQRSGIGGNPVGTDVDHTRLGAVARLEIGSNSRRRAMNRYHGDLATKMKRYDVLTSKKTGWTPKEAEEIKALKNDFAGITKEIEKISRSTNASKGLKKFLAVEAGWENHRSLIEVAGLDPVNVENDGFVGRVGLGVRFGKVITVEGGAQYQEIMGEDGKISGYVKVGWNF